MSLAAAVAIIIIKLIPRIKISFPNSFKIIDFNLNKSKRTFYDKTITIESLLGREKALPN